MSNTCSRFLTVVVFAVSVICFSSSDTFAQVEKGTKEILLFSSGFSIDIDNPEVRVSDGNSTIFGSFGNTRTFNIGGKLGYFLSQRNEIGAGTNLSVIRLRFCGREFRDGQLINENCHTDTRFSQGLSGFYRYNFAGKGSKRFPFVGAELSVSELTRNYTGNFKLRPQAGYKYFFNKNVAMDLSIGYTMELNEKRDPSFLVDIGRQGRIDGQFGLSFVF